MIEVFKALFVGLVCGIVFGFLKLPIPAPNALAGVVAIIGVYLGSILIGSIVNK